MSPKTICTKICLCFLFLLLYFTGWTQVIKGIVLDARTGEPMTGATVTIKEADRRQFVRLSSFLLCPSAAYSGGPDPGRRWHYRRRALRSMSHELSIKNRATFG